MAALTAAAPNKVISKTKNRQRGQGLTCSRAAFTSQNSDHEGDFIWHEVGVLAT